MIWRSLKFRLLALATLCIVGALVAYWAVLAQIFERHVSERLYHELEAHLNLLTAQLDLDDKNELQVETTPDHPSFQRPFGGLYWQVNHNGRSAFASRSLWDNTIEVPDATTQPGEIARHRDIASNIGTLMAINRTVLLGEGSKVQPVRVIVALDQGVLETAKTSFQRDVAILVALLALFLLIAAVAQTAVGLRPLDKLRQRLFDVAGGRAETLRGNFPSEVERLVRELNSLLRERTELVERARASASDLAHGLKTPLAILSAESRSLVKRGEIAAAGEIDQQVKVMNRHIERQLARARARGQATLAHEATDLKPTFARLVNAFRQLPGGHDIDWQQSIPDGIKVDVDPMDFEEIAGNILDNARKWTTDKINIEARPDGDKVEIKITDNGPGVPVEQLPQILERGGRLDETVPGSGLGLAIIQDILDIYDGQLLIRNLKPAGLCVHLHLPAVAMHEVVSPA